MKFSNHRTLSVLEKLFAVSSLLATLSQTQQSDKDVTLWVLVAEERLPSTIRDVVSSYKLELVRLQDTRVVSMWYAIRSARVLTRTLL